MSSLRLRHIAEVNPSTPEFDLLADGESVTFLPLEAVWPGAGLDVSQTRLKSEVSNGYTRFRENDVLVPKITPTFEANRSTIACGLHRGIGAGTTELHIVRPSSDIDVRYTNYLLASRPFLQGGKAAMKGVAGQQRVPDEWLRQFPVPLAEPLRQRAIADFLDAETARIDALIVKKRRLIELASLRVWRDFESTVDGLGAPQVPLRRCIRSITDGPFGSAFRAEDYSESGALVVRLGNIGFGEFRGTDTVFIPLELYSHFLRHRVSAGDLLIAGLGDESNHAGRACVAPDLGRAIVKGKCFCAQIENSMADSNYLALFLSSQLGAEAIGVEARGSTRTMINLEIVKAATLPLPSVQQQRDS